MKQRHALIAPLFLLLVAGCASLKTVPEDALVHVAPTHMPTLVSAEDSLVAARETLSLRREALEDAKRETDRAARAADRAGKQVRRLETRKRKAVVNADERRTVGLHAELEKARATLSTEAARLTAAHEAQREAAAQLKVAEARVDEREAWRELARAKAVAESGGSLQVTRYRAQHEDAVADLEDVVTD